MRPLPSAATSVTFAPSASRRIGLGAFPAAYAYVHSTADCDLVPGEVIDSTSMPSATSTIWRGEPTPSMYCSGCAALRAPGANICIRHDVPPESIRSYSVPSGAIVIARGTASTMPSSVPSIRASDPPDCSETPSSTGPSPYHSVPLNRLTLELCSPGTDLPGVPGGPGSALRRLVRPPQPASTKAAARTTSAARNIGHLSNVEASAGTHRSLPPMPTAVARAGGQRSPSTRVL